MASNSPRGEDCPLLCAQGWGIERQVKKPPACAWGGGHDNPKKSEQRIILHYDPCPNLFPCLTVYKSSSTFPRPTLFVSVHPALRSQVIFNREA